MSEKQRQNAKRNNNKDKGMMKMKEDVKDCLMDDFWLIKNKSLVMSVWWNIVRQDSSVTG